MKTERLDKIIAARTALSRKQVKELVRKGEVLVDGVAATAPDQKIAPYSCLQVAGQPVQGGQYLYLMLNKPKGVVSASRDSAARTVVDLVPPELWRKGLFPAGRLDRDTEGFVLLTDDGALAHDLLAPRRHVDKRYEVELDGPVPPELVEVFARGVQLSDHLCLPALLERSPNDPCRAEVVLHEGRYHQIKRMFAAFGLQVVALKRTRIGMLWLDPALAPGECRALTAEELQLLQLRDANNE